MGHVGAHGNDGEGPQDAVGNERPCVRMTQRAAEHPPAGLGPVVGRENVGVLGIAEAALAAQPDEGGEAAAQDGAEDDGQGDQGKATPLGAEPGGEPGRGGDHGGSRHGDGLLVEGGKHDRITRVQFEVRWQAEPLPARPVNLTAGAAHHAAGEVGAEGEGDAENEQAGTDILEGEGQARSIDEHEREAGEEDGGKRFGHRLGPQANAPVEGLDQLRRDAGLEQDVRPDGLQDQLEEFVERETQPLVERLGQHGGDGAGLAEQLEDAPLGRRDLEVGLSRDVFYDQQAVDGLAVLEVRGQSQDLGGKREIGIHTRQKISPRQRRPQSLPGRR